MNAISSVAVAGMQEARLRLQVSAHNVANLNTVGFQPREVVQGVVTTSHLAGGAPEVEVVRQLQAKNSFLASLSVFKASQEMIGTLLDVRA